MSILSKIILVVVVLVSGAFLFKLYVNNADDTESTVMISVGSPNTTMHEQGGVIPTTVGYSTEEVQPLNTILDAGVSSQLRTVLNHVHLDDYAVFPCNTDPNGSNVVMFTLQSELDGEFYTTRVAQEAVTAWEPYVYRDIGQLIFPQATLPPSPPLVSLNAIGDDQIRRAPVNFAETGGAFVYAGSRANYVFYGGTLQCLEAAMDLVYQLD